VSEGARPPLRLALWADAWPALCPPGAVVERIPWRTPPVQVAHRAQGLGAEAVVVLLPVAEREATRWLDRLVELRRHSRLPLWLVGAGELPSAFPPAGLEPWRRLRSLDPEAVEAARRPEHAAGEEGERAAVVTVFSPCGGAGVTTLALALGQTLAAWRIPTVLVDLNLHAPDLAARVGVPAAAADPPVGLEAYLRRPGTAPLPVEADGSLLLVPGLERLEALDDVRVAHVVALLDRLRPAVRVVDTASVVSDPAVYAALRSASHVVLVSDDRPAHRRHLVRYRRLFLQLGLSWRRALWAVNQTRPGGTPVPSDLLEEEVGIRPAVRIPYRPALAAGDKGARADPTARQGVETLAAAILGSGRDKGSASP
jgi:MinD-like ATPase involved in chromosome partitioning or flagellar assembly